MSLVCMQVHMYKRVFNEVFMSNNSGVLLCPFILHCLFFYNTVLFDIFSFRSLYYCVLDTRGDSISKVSPGQQES